MASLNARKSPACESDPLSEILQRVGQPPLLDEAALGHGDLAQRVVGARIAGDAEFLEQSKANIMLSGNL